MGRRVIVSLGGPVCVDNALRSLAHGIAEVNREWTSTPGDCTRKDPTAGSIASMKDPPPNDIRQ
jgi:hypothetical protein